MRVRSRVLLAAGTLLVLLIGTGLPAQAAPTVVLSTGHVDALYPLYQANQLQDYLLDNTVTPSVTRNPADVLLEALPNSKTTVPADARFAFLGAVGAPVWILPQTQDPALLWAGISTEGIATGVFQGNVLVFRLVSVSGPGQFSVFDTGPFGDPTVIYNSSAALPQDLTEPIPTHHHTNWAFGMSGSYTVTFQISGTLTNGTPVTTGPVAYQFQVDA